ncbi:succinate dehydrogenase/fumarate reductase, cytochrome b subunit [Bathymodiolus platifrons methanotrophic gill symbiont]|uniref:succinate dehydrogenase, cytochrome b556 subunit n=1 Tax=Bathymodiolus platifrons methanotrophic gill symbiont TaxID=113268 RepID=UPI0011C8B08D|nr:succinate dehydrogenase, cytochrome b556 subunit [Bathymodiolus platifrons methanotrophic gill symbiont]TXK98161.1 succinate dehydrogenase, cytochrome b556 subunit [Methylococcaceae bacterium HT1]TXL17750.1 succinate dehydrogenase, cytochrome b556 subunit [Methylococcaceae bacterium HT3]TXL22083.1 succinate dehydrogenase, cytochrome b556 subunit [Methylococcaceae bacterium HT2]GFO75379.1 succinate dehydrogenase/fumarate reductase, cytochrome b subunit [Bathymodiolus platifrons methanotrophic
MQQRKRPLSPHLQVYKLPLTGMVSIMHRMMGVLLTAGLVLFVISLAIIQCGASSFESMQTLIQQPLIGIALWLMIYALFFHLCHGVRHLIWDAGEGYEKALMNYYILLEMFAAIALTFLSFLFVQVGS